MVIDKDNMKLLLVILVVALGIGYAYINSDLNINGTAKIKNANWDVHWANVQIKSGSVTGANVVTEPTIDSEETTVAYSVVLPTPGTYYEFTVDAVNAGSIDAMIDTIDSKLNGSTITTTLPDYLSYEVTYSDGTALQPNHELKANTTETYKVKIKYRDDITLSQIPASDQTLSLEFTVTYKQANDNAMEVDHPIVVYTANLYDDSLPNGNVIQIGQAIPSGVIQYNSASEAMAAFENRPFYLKHLIRNGIIEESYVEFVVSQTLAQANPGMTVGTYTLRGFVTYDEDASSTNYCKAEYYTGEYCINPYYESNMETLLSAFGSSNCNEGTITGNEYYACEVSGLNAGASSNGNVNAYDDSWRTCKVSNSGSSGC